MNRDDNFPKSWKEKLSLAVNVLQNTPKIWHITKGDIFQIRVTHSDEKMRWMSSFADFAGLWDSLTCWLSKQFLKRCFLKSGLTKSFRVWNFRNKVAMTIIFFSKSLKFDVDSRKETKKSEKIVGCKDNCTWIGFDKFTQSRTRYLSLAVNVLRNAPKI